MYPLRRLSVAEKIFDMKFISYVTDIKEGYIETKKNKISLLEVTPINFGLKSMREQEMILDVYKSFLKRCEFDFQLFIQTTKIDIAEHIEKVRKCVLLEPEISEMAEDYVRFLENFSNERRSIARRFFIVVENNDESKIQNILQGLSACGNNVKVCTKEECEEILKECYKNFNSYTNHDVEDTQDEILKIYPFYFEDTNPNFLKVNNKYIGTLIVNDYAKEMQQVFFNKLLSLDIDLTCSIFCERLSTSEVLKKITYNIGNAAAEIKTTNENQSDAEILDSTYDDAKYIRKKIQLEQEKLYNLYVYFSVCSDTEEILEKELERLEIAAGGVGLVTRRGNFRQKETFEATMPIFKNLNELKKFNKRNVLSEGLCATYPFISNELFDKNGVLVGVNDVDKSLIMIDRFDTKKYKNSNMCVIGTSGSGKSYFTKLMILRNRYLNISQYVIDPEREYLKICRNLNGSLINFEDGKIINVLDIREFSDDGEGGYLKNKLNKLNTFFSILFPDITQEEHSLLEEKVIEAYKKRGITFDDDSLFYDEENTRLISSKRFKKETDMPTLGELYKLVSKDKTLKRIAVLLKPYVNGSLSFLNGYTNIKFKNNLVVADVFGLEENVIPVAMYVITEFFWDKIKESRSEKKIIYLDEAWRLIGNSADSANFVYKMFKTIRKYGGAVTAITQDINDFFTLEDGKFGKSILNNSSVKTIFQLEENDLRLLKENLNLSEEEILKIPKSRRGQCLICAGANHVDVKVVSSEKEHECVTTEYR